MEEASTAVLETPAAEAADAAAAASEESAASPIASTTSEQNAMMNALLRGTLGAGEPTSKPDAADDAEDADAADGESAPTGDVKPSDTPAPGTGRRASAQRIADLEAEVARLQKAYDEANPPPPDASEEARKAILAREQRYRDLNHRPDEDPIFNEGDNYAWLQEEKRRRAVAPELRQQYEVALEEDRKVLAQQVEAERAGFWNHVRADMATAREVPGVDFEAVKAAKTFAERDRILYAAGVASTEAELKRLREENADLRRDLYGTTRAPLSGGRSSPGRTFSENDLMNTLIRGGRI